jgi:antitoxin component YwqK of YwqJK toxin-antitoxin module
LIKEEGKYLGGEKHGNWYEYNNSGEQLQVIEYKRGEVNRIDGFKVEPISDTVE